MDAARPPRGLVWRLRALHALDRLRVARLHRRHPGLEIHRDAGASLAHAHYRMARDARLRIGPGVVTERRPGALRFLLEPGAEVVIGAGSWLRTDLGPVVIAAFAGARIELGPECFLNGSHLSAKRSLTLGRRAWVGPGSRVFDADQHDFDAERPEQAEPVEVGDHTWVGSDVTILRGVRIGSHSIIGARSVVTRSIPDHTLAFGTPAAPRGEVGDRSHAR